MSDWFCRWAWHEVSPLLIVSFHYSISKSLLKNPLNLSFIPLVLEIICHKRSTGTKHSPGISHTSTVIWQFAYTARTHSHSALQTCSVCSHQVLPLLTLEHQSHQWRLSDCCHFEPHCSSESSLPPQQFYSLALWNWGGYVGWRIAMDCFVLQGPPEISCTIAMLQLLRLEMIRTTQNISRSISSQTKTTFSWSRRN